MTKTASQKRVEVLEKENAKLESQLKTEKEKNVSLSSRIRELEEDEKNQRQYFDKIFEERNSAIKKARFYKEAAEGFKLKYEALNEAIKSMAKANEFSRLT